MAEAGEQDAGQCCPPGFLTPPLLPAGGPLPDKLQDALMPVVDHEQCTQPDWWGSLAIRTTMICAGGAEQAGCNVSAFLHCATTRGLEHPKPS